MELMYPIAIIICLILSILLFFVKFNRKGKYTNGKKVANTKYIKETEYYKTKLKKYKILSTTIKILSIICILITSILVARPITVQNRSEDKYNRDILLGLDISTSECEVNLELAKKIREMIPKIKGDRIGIVIYNTAPVVFCPLTDDYDYIIECLDVIERQSKIVMENNGRIPISFDEEGLETIKFWDGGATANSLERGSSLVGDGLAGTLFSFPNLKTDNQRTRIIIFATDNAVSGDETLSLEEACELCKKYDINLYAYCPSIDMNEYTSEEKINSYRKAVEENGGGKFYTGNLDRMTASIVDEIKETKASLLKTSKKTYVTDHPEIFSICIIIVFFILIIIEKRVRV